MYPFVYPSVLAVAVVVNEVRYTFLFFSIYIYIYICCMCQAPVLLAPASLPEQTAPTAPTTTTAAPSGFVAEPAHAGGYATLDD